MKNKPLILSIIAIIVLGGIVFAATRNTNQPETSTGPIQSHRSYSVKSDLAGKTYTSNIPNEYSFSIVDERGDTLKDFAITHTKPMHVIVVRKDLAYFQHVHPDYSTTTGTFTLKDLTFPADGEYRTFADFAAEGGQKDAMGMPLGITLSEDVKVGTTYSPKSIGTEEKAKTFEGYQVSLNTHDQLISGQESMLMFSLSQNGKPVTDLEEYLGALGHSVILKEGTLDFIHAHPIEIQNQTGTVSFMVNFPEGGKYKAFTQFQKNGKVFTTDFVVTVTQGADSMENTSMPGTDHSMH